MHMKLQQKFMLRTLLVRMQHKKHSYGAFLQYTEYNQVPIRDDLDT